MTYICKLSGLFTSGRAGPPLQLYLSVITSMATTLTRCCLFIAVATMLTRCPLFIATSLSSGKRKPSVTNTPAAEQNTDVLGWADVKTL